MTNYIAKQLDAQGGIQSLGTAAGTTFSVEWMVHRLLLAGAKCRPSKFIRDQRNPLKGEVTVVNSGS